MRKNKKEWKPLICPECGKESTICMTRYGRRDDCKGCDLHSWGGKPLMDPDTLQARNQAHEAFDPLWQSELVTRDEAYALLSQELKLPEVECHMSTMSLRVAILVPPAANKIRTELESK